MKVLITGSQGQLGKELLKNINYWRDAPVWTPKKISKVTKSWFKLLKKT